MGERDFVRFEFEIRFGSIPYITAASCILILPVVNIYIYISLTQRQHRINPHKHKHTQMWGATEISLTTDPYWRQFYFLTLLSLVYFRFYHLIYVSAFKDDTFECQSMTHIYTHYCDVIMGTLASQVTSLTTVYSTIHSGADQRKHQRSASLAFVRGIHRWPVNYLQDGQ